MANFIEWSNELSVGIEEIEAIHCGLGQTILRANRATAT